MKKTTKVKSTKQSSSNVTLLIVLLLLAITVACAYLISLQINQNSVSTRSSASLMRQDCLNAGGTCTPATRCQAGNGVLLSEYACPGSTICCVMSPARQVSRKPNPNFSPIPTVLPSSGPLPSPVITLFPSVYPTSIPTGEMITKTVGEQEGSFLIKKINPESVEGLFFQLYPIERLEGVPKTIVIGDDIGYSCEGVSEKLISINYPQQTVTFYKVVGKPPVIGCPICLSSDVLIDTPKGQVPVTDVLVGSPVWTVDRTGQRILGKILKTSKVPVGSYHQMVHLVLADAREVLVSPGHPVTSGQTVEDLSINDTYNGSRVVSVNRVTYTDRATYDILPSGETGFYWANGILLDSTLH